MVLAALAVGAACGGQRETPKPIAIAASSSSATGMCVLLPEGTVTCWGSVVGTRTPTQLRGVTDAVAISLGCIVRRNGHVACFDQLFAAPDAGDGDAGAAGLSPALVDVPGINDARSVSVGVNVACAVRATGAVSCWGTSNAGELGSAVAIGATSGAVDIVGVTDATQVTVGANVEACALTSTGTVLCWGSLSADNGIAMPPYRSTTPVVVPLPSAAIALTTGFFPACAILASGEAWCWDETSVPNGPATPAAIPGISDAIALSSGHCVPLTTRTSCPTCAVRRDGSVVCWGLAGGGLVLGSPTMDIAPATSAAGLPPAKQIAIGLEAACILAQDGSVWCWGFGGLFGELGPAGNSAATPVRVPL